jgi:hypothetical protein
VYCEGYDGPEDCLGLGVMGSDGKYGKGIHEDKVEGEVRETERGKARQVDGRKWRFTTRYDV